jgi:hypothetical protein
MPDTHGHDHFVIVGAQRCGTTYLYRLLDQHPEIEMAKPLVPEPKFFLDDDQYGRGLEYYDSAFFSESGVRVRGEKSTSYIESEVAVRRIKTMLPDGRVIVVLRDPVHRAISNYRFSVQNRVEELPIGDAMRAAAAGGREWDHTRFSVSPFDYLARGRYADYLERLTRHLDPEHLDVLFFEDLVAGNGTAALYRRFGVDSAFEPDGIGIVVNPSEASHEPFDPELEGRLRDWFREPNQRLAAVLGRELPWPG